MQSGAGMERAWGTGKVRLGAGKKKKDRLPELKCVYRLILGGRLLYKDE